MRPFHPISGASLTAGARTMREVAGSGFSVGARSVREVADSFRQAPWAGDRSVLAVPPELRRDRVDLVLLLVSAGLFLAGLIMVFSSSTFIDQFTKAGPYSRVLGQAARGAVGIALLVVAMKIDYRRWIDLSPWIAAATFFLLVLVLVPGIGHAQKGAQRWLGYAPFVIQPTEFARVGLILYLARMLSKTPEKMEKFTSGPLPALLVAGLFMLAVKLQPNLGSTAAIALTVVAMCIVAGMRWKHLLILVVPVVVIGILALMGSEVFHLYQLKRLQSWIDFWRGVDNGLKETWQLRQSILSISSGGIFGRGIGLGQQKWYFLPDAHTDFIYSIIGEETGLIGSLTVLLLFGALLWRGLRIAREAEDRYGYMLAAGLTLNFAVYAVINMSVTMALMPVTGLPLPLVSYGGSALISNLVMVGLLLSISRHGSRGIVLTGSVRRRSFQ